MSDTNANAAPRQFSSFKAGFATAFEEEISGESYFDALSKAETDPRRSALWAKLSVVERCTHTALRPVAAELGVIPTDEIAVLQTGRDEAVSWQVRPWHALMETIVRDYPAYIAEFETLKLSAPLKAQAAVQLLIDHEIAIIEMARAELAGADAPDLALDAYLEHVARWPKPATPATIAR